MAVTEEKRDAVCNVCAAAEPDCSCACDECDAELCNDCSPWHGCGLVASAVAGHNLIASAVGRDATVIAQQTWAKSTFRGPPGGSVLPAHCAFLSDFRVASARDQITYGVGAMHWRNAMADTCLLYTSPSPRDS